MKSVQEHYREYAPHRALQPYVACFWTSTAPAASSSHRVLPDGCIDILFDLSGERYPDGTIIGTMTRPMLFETDGPVQLVAVRFRPGGAVPFLGLSAHEVTDSQGELADVWRVNGLADRMREEGSDRERVGQLESALLARLADCGELDLRVQTAVSCFIDVSICDAQAIRILALPKPASVVSPACIGNAGLDKKPGRSVEEVAAIVDVSRQQLNRLFRRHVGVSPKQFARVMRMQGLRSRLRGIARPDWSALALESGYYDQAHMIAECRALAGVTPTELARR